MFEIETGIPIPRPRPKGRPKSPSFDDRRFINLAVELLDSGQCSSRRSAIIRVIANHHEDIGGASTSAVIDRLRTNLRKYLMARTQHRK